MWIVLKMRELSMKEKNRFRGDCPWIDNLF